MKEGHLKRALVTGATGYIGYNLVHKLLSDEWEVHVIARSDSDTRKIIDLNGNLTLHCFDGNIESMDKILEMSSPWVVFHLASMFRAEHLPQEIASLVESNVLFSTQLVDSMVRHNVYRLVNTGTSWQHYQNRDYDPVCLYAATKQAFESILEYYTQAFNLKVITLKLFDTYGPNDWRRKLFTLLRESAKSRQSLSMSPGEQLIDLVYIEDVVQAFVNASDLLATTHDSNHYAISTGSPLKLRDVVELYCDITGVRLNVDWGKRGYRAREVMTPWSTGLLLPGWNATTRLAEGIRKMELLND